VSRYTNSSLLKDQNKGTKNKEPKEIKNNNKIKYVGVGFPKSSNNQGMIIKK
jgi:hypothetical protein